MAQIGQVAELQEELATATWQAQLLADQRDAILDFLKQEEASGSLRGTEGADYRWVFGQIYQILITDPRDASVVPGSGVPVVPVQFHQRHFEGGGYALVYPTCVCGAQWLEQSNRCVAAPATMIVTRRES